MSTLAVLDEILSGTYVTVSAQSQPAEPEAASVSNGIVQHSDEDPASLAVVNRLVELKQSIVSCDEVLERIQTYMTTFRADLLTVTSDIESLQERSNEMSRRLQNRKDLEAVLGPAIEESVLSPQLIRRIIEAPVDRNWLSALNALEQFGENETKTRTIDTTFPTQEIEKLRSIAAARIRDYLVMKIKSMRLPKSNVAVIQQSGLLRLRKLYAFLCKYHDVLSSEIMQAYCLTMRWYYQYSFEKYQRALSRIHLRNITKQELLGAEDVPRSLGNMFSTSQQTAKKESISSAVLTLGTRAKYLHDNNTGIILAYVAETEKETYFLERVFRSYIISLVENAAVEYLFMNEFFQPKGSRTISEHYAETFEPLFVASQQYVKQIISDSLDVLGILTCIRVVQKLSFDIQKRKVAGLESFLDGLLITLWPKLQSVMDAHCQSLKNTSVSVTAVNASATQKTALPITKKFSDLVFGILVLSKGSREEEPVNHSLDRLVHDFESCLVRMAGTCQPKLRNQFLYRNYLAVSEQIENTSGVLAEKHKKEFRTFVESWRA